MKKYILIGLAILGAEAAIDAADAIGRGLKRDS